MNWLRLFRQGDNATRRLSARRPLVEALEGRQLLSGIVGNHIGVSADGIQGQHIGSAMIVGQHIGTSMIVGAHIGTGVV